MSEKQEKPKRVRTKKEPTTEEKRAKINESIAEINEELRKLPQDLSNLETEKNMIAGQHLPAIKELVEIELDELRGEEKAFKEDLEKLNEELKTLV